MKCCIVFEVINGYEVVTKAGERTYDPQETVNYVKTNFPGVKGDEFNRLCDEHKQYAPLQNNEKALPDNTCHEFREKIEALTEHEKCLTDGTIIPDYRGTEYWKKEDGHWGKDKINELGKSMPNGAVVVDDLGKEQYAEQHQEIRDQEERERIAALTPEALKKELQAALDALADEAARLEKRAQIQRKDFDPAAWYEEEERKLNQKYGISKE
jgi:hypothetical protein